MDETDDRGLVGLQADAIAAVVKMLRQKVRQKTSYRGDRTGDQLTWKEVQVLNAAIAAGWLEDPRAQK